METKIAGVLNWDSLIRNATPSFSAATKPAEIISQIVLILFPLAGGVLLIFLIIGGYKWMTSAGDPKKVAGARGTITNAIIGLLIMFAAYWIVQFIAEIFNIEALREIF